MLGKYPQVDIDENYLSETVDCSLKEINSVLSSAPFDLSLASKRRQSLQQQLNFVTRKVSQIILDRQQSYATELNRVLELEEALRQAKIECHNARSHIGVAKSVITDRGLYLLGNCRHRRQLLLLLRVLLQIRCIRGTNVKLTNFLMENDYSSAIELGIACQREASSLSRFDSLKDTSLKLQDALQSVEETMDSALSKHCIHFDSSSYAKLQAGYILLGPGKLQVAADQLIMHAVNTLQDRCHSVLVGYAALIQQEGDCSEDVLEKGRPFADVCRAFAGNMDPNIVIAGVRDCAEAAWQILSNYLRIYHWHMSSSIAPSTHPNGDLAEDDGQSVLAAEEYVKTKLSLGKSRIWQEVDGRIRVLLISLCLDHFGSENFLQLLDVLHILPMCGQWFAECESPSISEAIIQLAGKFFRSFHMRSLEETRLFFENETWTICPLPRDFTIWKLPELKLFAKSSQQDRSQTLVDFNNHFEEDTSPFSAALVAQSPSPTRDRGVSMAFGDDLHGVNGSGGSDNPNQYAPVANSTVSVIRLMAQYVCLLQPLATVAMDVITGIADLCDRYLFSVFQIVRIPAMVSPPIPISLYPTSQRLNGTLQRIQEQHGASFSAGVPLPISGLDCAYRILAAESVVFLSAQVDQLKSTLEKHVPSQKSAFLVQFYSQSVKAAEDLRTLAYFPIGAYLIDSGALIQRILVVNFEPAEIQMQHSGYVDWIIQSILIGVDNVTRSVNEVGNPCPPSVRTLIIAAALRCATHHVLEGYSQVKRCKGEGRALMQLDVEQLSKAAERKLNAKPPLPGRDLLVNFMKAFYLRDDAELETWMKDHREYSSTQLQGLVTQLPWLTQRSKRRLIDLIVSSNQTSNTP